MATSHVITGHPLSSLDPGGDHDWQDIDRIRVEDGSTADCNLTKEATSNTANVYSHAFDIPLNATITGIYLEVKCYGQSSVGNVYISDVGIYLRDSAGNPKGNNYAITSDFSDTLTWYGYGGSTDLWGVSWSPADINNGNFGSLLTYYNRSTGSGSLDMRVDAERITIYYDEPDASAILLAMGAF